MLINRLDTHYLESLSSYISRLGKANYYEESNWINDFLSGVEINGLDYLDNPISFFRLSELTGLSVGKLYSMTVHAFYEMYNPRRGTVELLDKERPFWKQEDLVIYIHGKYVHKICPYCWAKYPVYWLTWRLRQVTMCMIHQVLLIDHCSTCKKSLRINFQEGKCTYCETPLQDMQTLSTKGDFFSR